MTSFWSYASKCSFSIFGDRGIDVDHVADLPLTSENSTHHKPHLKYLGVIVDENLTFILHYNMVTAKCDILYSKIARIQFNIWNLAFSKRYIYKGQVQISYGYDVSIEFYVR